METVNVLRTLITTASFVLFVLICLWAYSARSRSRFDEAAQLPFTEDDLPASTDPEQGRRS
jgi:cytochrome c oxidase cbb3-type subunit IV